MTSRDEERQSDLEEAGKLDKVAEGLAEGSEARREVEAEAAAYRRKWEAPAELVVLAEVGAETREADLKEADRLTSMASTLRQGSAARSAVEADAAALRAKWPEFMDDSDGQVKRLTSFLLTRGMASPNMVPARVVLAHVTALESELAEVKARLATARRPCHACGLPPHDSTPVPNAFLIEAVRYFEKDAAFREQVKSGQVAPGQSTHPWIPRSEPHKGPLPGTSPWALATLATMVRNDSAALSEVGPLLRAAFRERNVSVPEAPTTTAGAGAPRLGAHGPN
jgi:hypothetical protein